MRIPLDFRTVVTPAKLHEYCSKCTPREAIENIDRIESYIDLIDSQFNSPEQCRGALGMLAAVFAVLNKELNDFNKIN